MPAKQQLGLNTLLGAGQGLSRRPCPAPHPGSLTAVFNIIKKGTFLLWSNRGHFYCGMTTSTFSACGNFDEPLLLPPACWWCNAFSLKDFVRPRAMAIRVKGGNPGDGR